MTKHYMFRTLLFVVLFSIFGLLSSAPAYAQQNVSCNNSYYLTGNKYNVKVPGTSGNVSLRMTFNFAAGSMRINIKNGSTNLETLNYTTPGIQTDTRNVPAGATITYEMLIVRTNGTTAAPGRWMPPNVPPNRATCGTGCSNQQGGYFVLVPLAPTQAKAVEGGYSYVDLSQTYTLFKMAERTKNTVDTATACINDQVGGNQGGTADDDFNDMIMMWTYKAAAQSIPTVQTNSPAQDINKTSARILGKVLKDGGSALTERGFVYSKTETTPTIGNATKVVVAGSVLIGGYEKTLTGLTADTKYYFRAYAKNAIGIGYGAVVNFTTRDTTVPTVVTKSPATEIRDTSAKFSGEVTSNGGAAITERGFVYSKSATTPTLENASKLTVAGGVGDYAATATGLSSGSKYYFRAYARNEKGVAYGVVVSFTSGHTPQNTGFEEEPLLYIGGFLYVVGVITFMGARVLSTKRAIRR